MAFNKSLDLKKSAFSLIILLGIVSLLSDITYEGARSIVGAYLALLGAGATAVGIVAGFGELVGYSLRFVSGYIADKTKRYWLLTIFGYTVNLFCVPLLAFAKRWEIAVILIILERIGKAIRTPSRDVILSYATKEIGRGWGFGLHEAMDQVGAMLGPSLVALILFFTSSFKISFLVLFIPASFALILLFISRHLYPDPKKFEKVSTPLEVKGFSRMFWIYVLATSFFAAGYVDFALIAYHFKKVQVALDVWIPIFYAIAMGIDALTALLFGKLFDKKGLPIISIAVFVSLFFAPLVFLGNFYTMLLGIILWGIGMGAQESIMRAAIANIAPADKRATAYGLFNTFYGVSWFLGSAVMGLVYEISIFLLVGFSVLMQLLSLILFIKLKSLVKKN